MITQEEVKLSVVTLAAMSLTPMNRHYELWAHAVLLVSGHGFKAALQTMKCQCLDKGLIRLITVQFSHMKETGSQRSPWLEGTIRRGSRMTHAGVGHWWEKD